MQHSHNMYEITPHRIKQTVRKSRKKCSANIGNYLSIKQRCLFQTFWLQLHCGDEFFSESDALQFIPFLSFANFP